MRLLLDTHVLLWAAYDPERLPQKTAAQIADETNEIVFSVASIWEVVIKAAKGRDDFDADPHVLRRELLENGYVELPITGSHVTAVASMPPIHRDPFDRILVAQARVEGMTLLTPDETVAEYGAPVRLI